MTYDVWDVYAVMHQEEPDLASLALYKKVIWWSGKEDFYAGPTAFSEYDLDSWFKQRGGCLLVTSQDYVFAREGVTDFMRQRLGVSSVVQDTTQSQVTGQGSVFTGLGTINLRSSTRDYSDRVTPDATAELAFSGNMGNAGIDKNGGYYRTSFLGFGAERLFSATNRAQALLKFLQWCDGLAGVDGDGDGVANSADCMPGDPQAWGPPSPVTDLMPGTGEVRFSWTQPASASGAVYDVLRSDKATDFWNATCLAVRPPGNHLPDRMGHRQPSTRQGLLLPGEGAQPVRDGAHRHEIRRHTKAGDCL